MLPTTARSSDAEARSRNARYLQKVAGGLLQKHASEDEQRADSQPHLVSNLSSDWPNLALIRFARARFGRASALL